jgi:transcription termination factor Rho
LPPKKNPPPESGTLPFGAGTFDSSSSPASPRAPRRGSEEPPARASGPAPARDAPAAPKGRGQARSEGGGETRSASREPARESRAEPAATRAETSEEPTNESGNESPTEASGAPTTERRGRRRRRGRGRGRGNREERPEAPLESGEPQEAHEPGPDGSAAPEESAPEEFAREARDEPVDGGPVEPAAPGLDDEADFAPGSAPRADSAAGPVDPSAAPRRSGRAERRRRWQERRRRRRLGLPLDDLAPQPQQGQRDGPREGQPPRPHPTHASHGAPQPPREPRPPQQEQREIEGMLVLEKFHAELRRREFDYLPSKEDVSVAPWQVQKFALRDGAIVKGHYRRGQGRSRWELVDVLSVDGLDPNEARKVPVFKNLVTIDPDFHYALGDGSGEVALKVVDVICPIGRGQRGLIVAPPRSGKTILLQQISKAIEKIYPDVHLMVLLIDERPEEATEWKRTVERGEVFVSTNDEPAKKHVELAEVVWRRARRLVELGKDVVLLLDSITRLGRAANNVWGTSGKTMSGGIDSRAMERPKALFGSARNTETAGSLTILGTTLVDTGSRMDQVIFEEFKGTGNMELVLSRKLSDRRIFPAIDLERSGTRKDEKLHSAKRLARCNTLRRVLMRMHFAEAMELLITKLGDVDKIDDFLQRFEIDPDAGDEGKQAVSPVRMRW